MAEINIPFQEQFREAMLLGRKTMTSRFKRYGHVGDEFLAFDAKFRLIAVARTDLSYVAEEHYREEGFQSTEEFYLAWKKIHPRRNTFDSSVWAHQFERASE